MRNVSLVPGFLAMLLTAACDRPAPTGPSSTPELNRVHAGVTGSATGGVHFTSSTGRRLALSFNAIQTAGEVLGNWEYHVEGMGMVRGRVNCISIQGDQAWMEGTIEHTTIPSVVEGTLSAFRVMDSGEGAQDPPDMTSVVIVNRPHRTAGLVCENRPTEARVPLLRLAPVEGGNIQVRSR